MRREPGNRPRPLDMQEKMSLSETEKKRLAMGNASVDPSEARNRAEGLFGAADTAKLAFRA